MKRVFISVIIALGIVSTNVIYFEYTCDVDESWPQFLGFPFVQSTDSSWGFSMSGDIFILGLLGNICFWTLIIYVIFGVFNLVSEKYKLSLFVGRVLVLLLVIYSLFFSFGHFVFIDWRLNWNHNNFKLHYYESDLDCKRTLHFFN